MVLRYAFLLLYKPLARAAMVKENSMAFSQYIEQFYILLCNVSTSEAGKIIAHFIRKENSFHKQRKT